MRVKVVGGSVCLEREREIKAVCAERGKECVLKWRERECVCSDRERVCGEIEIGGVRGERKRGRDRVGAE